MSGLSLPVNRPTGRALLVASPGSRARPLEILSDLGFDATEVDDPYAAMTELCRRPLVYRAVILSLASLYREELSIIATVKARFPHVELWLAHTDARQAALAEAMRLGADGLLADDGLHRVAGTAAPPTPAPPAAAVADARDTHEPRTEAAHDAPAHEDAHAGDDPVLSPDELRALLHEQSAVPPDEN
jgi:hypothetical protein